MKDSPSATLVFERQRPAAKCFRPCGAGASKLPGASSDASRRAAASHIEGCLALLDSSHGLPKGSRWENLRSGILRALPPSQAFVSPPPSFDALFLACPGRTRSDSNHPSACRRTQTRTGFRTVGIAVDAFSYGGLSNAFRYETDWRADDYARRVRARTNKGGINQLIENTSSSL